MARAFWSLYESYIEGNCRRLAPLKYEIICHKNEIVIINWENAKSKKFVKQNG